MDKDTQEAVAEMKFLYDCGADLDFLSACYSLSKENIEKFCNELDKFPSSKEELLKKYIDQNIYPIEGVTRTEILQFSNDIEKI